MLNRTNIAYCYDGTFDGFLSCVFEAYQSREIPEMLFPDGDVQTVLYPVKYITTDIPKANRVAAGLGNIGAKKQSFIYNGKQMYTKKSYGVLYLVQHAFLTCMPDKESNILSYITLAFNSGVSVLSMLSDNRVSLLENAVLHMNSEAHLLKGFVRFSDINGILTSTIEPKNHVLPLLIPHFAERFPNEEIIIFDKTHGSAACTKSGKHSFFYADSIKFDEPGENELSFRGLWKLFYDTVAIEERFNPKCRMSMMPKRYWKHMTEMTDSLS